MAIVDPGLRRQLLLILTQLGKVASLPIEIAKMIINQVDTSLRRPPQLQVRDLSTAPLWPMDSLVNGLQRIDRPFNLQNYGNSGPFGSRRGDIRRVRRGDGSGSGFGGYLQ